MGETIVNALMSGKKRWGLLLNMIKITDFNTLEDAKTAPLITRKVFNSNEMTMHLLRCDLLDDVLDATAGLMRGFGIRVIGDSRFDFRDNTDDGVANYYSLNSLITSAPNEATKSKFTALLDRLVSEANKTTYPFAQLSQDDFDKAHAEALLYGEQVPSAISYMGNNDKHVALANENVRFTVLLDAAVDVDTVVDFGLLIRNADDRDFSPVQNWSEKLTITAGHVIGSLDVADTRGFTRHVRFSATSNIKNGYLVEVTSA